MHAPSHPDRKDMPAPADLATCEQLFAHAPDADQQAMLISSAVTALWDEGRQFQRFDPWLLRGQQVLDNPGLSPAARAALGIHLLIARTLGSACLAELASALPALRRQVDEAGNDALHLLLAALDAYILVMGGDTHGADERIKDALPLARLEGPTLLPGAQLASMGALVSILRGDADGAMQRLDAMLTHRAADQLPAGILLMARAHRLQALAVTGNEQAIEQAATALREQIVPARNAYLQSYLHFSLGVADLLQGRPAAALTHAAMSIERALAGGCQAATLVPGLLHAQALADLARDTEAADALARSLASWKRHGYHLIAAAAHLEQTRLHLRQGAPAAARASLDAARRLLPADQALPDYHRPTGFAARLAAQCLPAPPAACPTNLARVRITTLGGFGVEIDGRPLYDRDWHGPRTKTLLKALIVLGGSKVGSAQLGDLLWPEAEGDRARQALKTALSRLRRAGLQPGQTPPPLWIATRHGQISLVSGLCTVDAIVFQHALAAAPPGNPAALDAALRLYRADFLPADLDEAWIVAHREHLRRLYLAQVRALAEQCLEQGTTGTAEPHLERALTLAPSDERHYALLIRLQLAAGCPGLASHTRQRAREALAHSGWTAAGTASEMP